ncbi:MAG: hypothetical protein HZB83_04540 [Deltaproteobacteria bacterium]|nr:hypothetical protein [Deltaproteobacteria bacterium]
MNPKYTRLAVRALPLLVLAVCLNAPAISAAPPPHTGPPRGEAAGEAKVSPASEAGKDGHEKDRDILAAIDRRQKDLDAREEALNVREERINSLKKDVSGRAAELGRLHGRIEALVKKLEEADEERVKKVVKIYESMAPEEVASRIEKLDEAMSVVILSSMSEKKAAKILGLVSVGKSVSLTRAMKIKKD